jgi:hypothetical protein
VEAEHDLTLQRIAENQSTFREANEKIEAAANNMGLGGPVPFICECADRSCTEIVRLTPEGYEEVRQHPRWFFTAPGHEDLSVDSGAGIVVARADGHVVVEKVGVAGEIAAEQFEELSD